MSTPGYILALDQGTTGTTAMLIDSTGMPLWSVNREIRQIYPRPGWVEHDPVELFESCLYTIEDLLDMAEAHPRSIVAMGITNQRETIVLWDRRTGEPLYNAIVWQCRRTAPLCDELKSRGLEEWVREKTGLPMDPYFSATKIRWLLDNVPDGQQRAERGELACGTVDSWLLWNFTNKLIHATDTTNASTTMLFNINTLEWDTELLELFDIPLALLPEVRSASEIFGYVARGPVGGAADPNFGCRGRSAGFYIRTGVFRTWRHQEYLRHRLFLRNKYRATEDRLGLRAGANGWVDAERRNDLRAGGGYFLGGRYCPVAKR